MVEVTMATTQAPRADSSAPDLSIIVVNWNTRQLLAQCLRSIFDDVISRRQLSIEVLVVDNGSQDGSVALVRESFPHVHLIENAENAGFACANNQGIARAAGQYLLLLNSDTEIEPGALLELFQFLEAHEGAGGAGARLLNPDRTLQVSCFPFPTVLKEFWYLLHLDLVWPYASYNMERWRRDDTRAVDVLLGACLMLRREALEQAGPLDERFFMYSEEVDLCYRLYQHGWRLYWVPQAEVVHHGGQSTRQVAEDMFLQLYRSKVKFFYKHYGPLHAWLYKTVLLLISLPRVLLPFASRLHLSAHRSEYGAVRGNYRRLIAELPWL